MPLVRGSRWGVCLAAMLGLLLASRAVGLADDDPPADLPASPPAGEVLKQVLENLFGNGRRESPRMRAAEEEAESERKPKDPIEARAPRDPHGDVILQRAEEAARRGDWKQAVEGLQKVLDLPEDSVHRTKDGRWTSLRHAASRRLGTAPTEVLADYEQRYGGLAEQLERTARETGDHHAVVELATRFFHTRAGAAAAMQLANWHFDRHEFGLALLWFEDLQAAKAAGTEDPRWQLKAAFAARQVAPDAVSRFLNPVLTTLGDRPLMLGGAPQLPGQWWKDSLVEPTGQTPVLNDWLQLSGNAARVGIAAQTDPLLAPLWTRPLTENPIVAQRLRWLLEDLDDVDAPTIMAGIPLAVGNRIVYRDLRSVRAVDAETGKTLWETPQGLSAERILGGLPAAPMSPAEAWRFRGNARLVDEEFLGDVAEDNPLSSLLFRDGTTGLISSDGERVFVLEDVAVLTRQQPGYQWDGEGEPQDPFGAVWSSNRLSSYDLSMGRSLWTVGGAASGEAFTGPLAGVFFLGAPVVDQGEVLVVGSQAEEVRLWALHPATGQPLWSQLLAYADTKIDLDLARRWVSAPVALGEGIIICPTTVGWLVAIDRLRRSVLWAHRYQSSSDSAAEEDGQQFLEQRALSEQWSPSSPVIVGDAVIFPAADAEKLICVGLRDGELRWQQPRDDRLSVAGVANGYVLTVGMRGVSALQLTDGREEWQSRWDEPLRPAGRGAIVGDALLVPLSNGELRRYSLPAGELVSTQRVPYGQPPLGNLVVAHGRLISLAPQGCSVFPERQHVAEVIAARLASEPDDVAARLRQIELLQLDRQERLAVERLRELVPTESWPAELRERRRRTLFQLLLSIVSADPSDHLPEFDELAQLAETAAERDRVASLRIDRLLAAGDALGAFEVLLSLTTSAESTEFRRFDDDATVVQRTAWWQGRLQDVWAAADVETRSTIAQRVDQLVTEAIGKGSDAIAAALLWWDGHPLGVRLAWARADTLASLQERGRAEAELARWITSEEATIAAESQVRLLLVWQQAGLRNDVATLADNLRRRFASVVLSDGKTVEQQLSAMMIEPKADVAPASNWDGLAWESQSLPSAYAPPVQEVEFPAGDLSRFSAQIEPQEQRLTLQDRRSGQWHWLVPLRSNPRESDASYSPTEVLQQRLVVLHRGVLQVFSPWERRVLWTRTLDTDQPGADLAGGQRHQPDRLVDVAEDEFAHDTVFRESEERGRLAVVTERYLCVLGRRSLTVFDTRTGAELWRNERISAIARLAAARDYLYVLNPDAGSVKAFRWLDGRSFVLPEPTGRLLGNSLAIEGNDLIVLERTNSFRLFGLGTSRVVLRRWDPWAKADRWKREFKGGTRAGTLLRDDVVVVEPAGGVQRSVGLIDLNDGARRNFDPVTLDPQAGSDADLYVLADAERFYLLANSDSDGGYHYGDSLPTLPANGVLAAWDRVGGKLLWRQTVTDQNLVLDRFQQSPGLTFLSRTWKEQGAANYTNLRVELLSKASGKMLFTSDRPAPFNGFHGLVVRERDPAVELVSYTLRLRLSPTATPAPQ